MMGLRGIEPPTRGLGNLSASRLPSEAGSLLSLSLRHMVGVVLFILLIIGVKPVYSICFFISDMWLFRKLWIISFLWIFWNVFYKVS